MQIPLQITLRNLEQSPALEANVREHAERLEKFYDGIIGCSVVVEARHKHHRHGNHYHYVPPHWDYHHRGHRHEAFPGPYPGSWSVSPWRHYRD